MRRVVITGQGAISALGRSAVETVASMREGKSGISELDFRDVDRLTIKIGGQIHGYDPETHFERQQIALYDRFTQFALIAAQEAVSQSGLSFDDALAERTGCRA